MKKRALLLVLVVALLVTAVVFMTNAETPPDYTAKLQFETGTTNAKCPHCNKVVSWTELTNTTRFPKITSGEHHYYLAGDVTNNTVDSTNSYFFLYLTGGKFCLHLNGFNLTTQYNAHFAASSTSQDATFNVMGSGTWTGKYTNPADANRGTAVTHHGSYGTINLYSGTFISGVSGKAPVAYTSAYPGTVGKINIYDDVTINGGLTQVAGNINMEGGTINGGVYLSAIHYASSNTSRGFTTTKFDMNGGTINGRGTEQAPYAGNGGAVYMENGAQMFMNDGIINSGYVTGNGGTVYVVGSSGQAEYPKDSGTIVKATKETKFTINGGTLHGGHAVKGGAIYATDGANSAAVIATTGGTIQNGTAQYGGNIALESADGKKSSTRLVHFGGTVTGGKAVAKVENANAVGGHGGNIYGNGCALTVGATEGTVKSVVTQGHAYKGGNIYSEYMQLSSNDPVDNKYKNNKILTVNVCAEISYGYAETVKISDSKSATENFGGNICSANNVLIYGTLHHGYAANGGCLALFPYKAAVNSGVIYKGAVIHSGEATASGGNVYTQNQLEVFGTIRDGKAAEYGGNVYSTGSVLVGNSDGTQVGVISGGQAKNGGNVRADSSGRVVVYKNSEISGGTATSSGGNIHNASSRSTIYGTVKDGVSYGTGGNVTVIGGILITVDGGTVSGGKAYGNGGNFQLNNGQLTLKNNGQILNGIANFKPADGSNDSKANGCGGNISCTAGVLTLTSGTISGGKAIGNDSFGGNIYISMTTSEGKELLNTTTITDVSILDGEANYLGGNIYADGKVTITMTGGTIKGGITNRTTQHNIRLNKLTTMTMTGGTVYGVDGAQANQGTAFNLNNSTLRLGGTARVIREDGGKDGLINIVSTRGKLQILNNWTGVASTYAGELTYGNTLPQDEADYNYTVPNNGRLAQTGTVTDGVFTKGGTYSGTLYYEMTGNPIAYGDNGEIKISGAQLVKADGTATWTKADPVAEYAAGAYAYLKYFAGDLTMNGDMVVDVNGKSLSVDGSGKLYAFDSANDTYEASKCGVVIVKGNVKVQNSLTINGKRYITLTDAAGNCSFHRVEMGLVGVALRAREAGYYYRAQYFFDDAVKAAILCHGIAVSKDNMPGADFVDETKDINAWTEMTTELSSGSITNSGSLFNIFKTGNTDNQARGEIKVYANPYLVLQVSKDDVIILVADEENADKQAGVGMSLKDVLVAIEVSYDDLGADAQQTVKQFYTTWEGDIAAWAPELPKISAK